MVVVGPQGLSTSNAAGSRTRSSAARMSKGGHVALAASSCGRGDILVRADEDASPGPELEDI